MGVFFFSGGSGVFFFFKVTVYRYESFSKKKKGLSHLKSHKMKFKDSNVKQL